MNCRGINHLLDTRARSALDAADRAAVERHLEDCPACRDQWTDFSKIASLQVPPMPPELRQRVAAALPRQEKGNRRRPRRPMVIGGLLAAGVGVAAAIALRLDSVPTGHGDTGTEMLAETETATADGQQVSPLTEVADGDSANVTESAAPVEADAALPSIALDDFSIVVVARPEPSADAETIAHLRSCYEAILEQLSVIAGINVIGGARLASFDQSGMSTTEIARSLGAGSAIEVTNVNGCFAARYNAETDEMLGMQMYAQSVPPADGWAAFARSVAESVRNAILKTPETMVAEARATLLDTARDDGERIAALDVLRRNAVSTPDAIDSAVVAAVAMIGTSSADARARSSAWVGMRRIDDPYLVEPLLYSLANDTDEAVRRQAALTLNTFLDQPGVRDALLRAAAEDPSSEPEVICCIPTVREAAQWAAVSEEALPAWARERLMDNSLPARSRLFPIASGSPDGRFVSISDLGSDATSVVFDIGRSEENADVRQMAWTALGLAEGELDDSFVPVLIDDLAEHPDEFVRAAAAGALRRYSGDPAITAALREAQTDPSLAVRRIADMAIVERGTP